MIVSPRLGALGMLLALGCRSQEPPGARVPAPSTAPTGSAAPLATAVPNAPSSAGAAAPIATASAAPVAPLPKLKPISKKPFPDGADEATVCEAIDSHEPDLWVRFGHLVPAYEIGAIYVLDTGPESKAKLERYIRRDYVYGYYAQQASCRNELTLLYIRKMFEKSEFHGKPFGREHLSYAIEQKFGIKTRESFEFSFDQERLKEYCRADAELCDDLQKLDLPNRGQGLCSLALSECEVKWHMASTPSLLQACQRLPRSMLSCLYTWRTTIESEACGKRVVTALCP